MSNEVKKAQEEMEKLMKQHMKDVYGENFENMGDLIVFCKWINNVLPLKFETKSIVNFYWLDAIYSWIFYSVTTSCEMKDMAVMDYSIYDSTS